MKYIFLNFRLHAKSKFQANKIYQNTFKKPFIHETYIVFF